jgi:hypothetical protein
MCLTPYNSAFHLIPKAADRSILWCSCSHITQQITFDEECLLFAGLVKKLNSFNQSKILSSLSKAQRKEARREINSKVKHQS